MRTLAVLVALGVLIGCKPRSTTSSEPGPDSADESALTRDEQVILAVIERWQPYDEDSSYASYGNYLCIPDGHDPQLGPLGQKTRDPSPALMQALKERGFKYWNSSEAPRPLSRAHYHAFENSFCQVTWTDPHTADVCVRRHHPALAPRFLVYTVRQIDDQWIADDPGGFGGSGPFIGD